MSNECRKPKPETRAPKLSVILNERSEVKDLVSIWKSKTIGDPDPTIALRLTQDEKVH
jgi:hypothetical protein